MEEPGAKMMIALIILLLAINSVAIWGIVYSGREAREEVLKDLELQATAGAKSLEAILASTRADFLFLTQSPPLADFRDGLSSEDPMIRRWRRLDIEATLLLFLSSHPEVERISLFGRETSPFLIVGRRDSAPVVLPSSEWMSQGQVSAGEYLAGQWTLGEPESGGKMEVLLSIDSLLRLAAPSQEYSLALRPLSELSYEPTERTGTAVTVSVQDPAWNPPIDWAIIWSEKREGLIQSVSRLTDRYRMTLTINVLLMSLAAVLGVLSVRQVRRGIALEVENRQQSQIRELERQLMHSERLASVGRLAAGLAHEINNPLEGMANYLLLLEEDIRQGQTESTLEFVGKIREGLDRAAGVTKRALTFAEPGQKPSSVVDLRRVVAETIEFVEGNSLFENISLLWEGLDQEVLVKGNPVTLGQAFLNLLLNAGEIQNGGGSIRIECCAGDGLATVKVTDTGPGIDEELLPKIFEPFHSGRGSTGLGLSICRTIIEQHEGTIEAFNRNDEPGAEFRVRIPLSDANAATMDADIAPTMTRMKQVPSSEAQT